MMRPESASSPTATPIQELLPASPVEVTVFCVLGAIAVFAIDHFTPRGTADGLLYGPVILMSLRTRRRASLARICQLCVILVVLGFLVSPDGAPLTLALVNRALTLLAILLTYLATRGLVSADTAAAAPGDITGSGTG